MRRACETQNSKEMQSRQENRLIRRLLSGEMWDYFHFKTQLTWLNSRCHSSQEFESKSKIEYIQLNKQDFYKYNHTILIVL